MLKEVCVENFTDIPAAIKKGGNRIELCDNLAVGGTTVSYGVMKHSITYCKEQNIPVMCIIRPRKGDFCYNEAEGAMMKEEIALTKELGAYGVVIGALTADKWLDEKLMKELILAASGMAVTFHMAFDEIPYDRQKEAIDWLSEMGVDRILTHGGKSGTGISDNVDNLCRLLTHAGERIIVMPGGGITKNNVDELYEKVKFREVHGTKIVG